MHTHTHPHAFNGPLSGTTQVSGTRKVKPIRILLKQETVSGNHTSTAPLSFLQARCPSCHPTNSIKALKAHKWVRKLGNLDLAWNLATGKGVNKVRYTQTWRLYLFSVAHCLAPAPQKSWPYGAIQIYYYEWRRNKYAAWAELQNCNIYKFLVFSRPLLGISTRMKQWLSK